MRGDRVDSTVFTIGSCCTYSEQSIFAHLHNSKSVLVGSNQMIAITLLRYGKSLIVFGHRVKRIHIQWLTRWIGVYVAVDLLSLPRHQPRQQSGATIIIMTAPPVAHGSSRLVRAAGAIFGACVLLRLEGLGEY